MDCESWEVVVVGAGAAGLLAATRAAERGRRTLLLEKNRKPGVKILISGGTRCNLTHDTDVAGIVREFGPAGKFLRTALESLPPSAVVQLFESEGVATKVEETGKVFPVSDRALDVQQALARRLARTDCVVHYDRAVEQLLIHDGKFELRTSAGPYRADRVVITTGGCSYPGCGTTGDAYAWLQNLGHTVVPPRPALVPLICEIPWVRALSGMTLPQVVARIVPRAKWEAASDLDSRQHVARKHALAARAGAVLFTHFGFSGPAVLDVSRAITDLEHWNDGLFVIDFCPTQTYEQTIGELLGGATRQGGQTVAHYLTTKIPQRLCVALLERVQISREQRCAELDRQRARQIASTLHTCEFPVHGTRGFAKAEVTAGGVDRRQIDPRTMQSKLVSGLFVAGEVLDVDGPIGGFNFQAAFSTGWLAGSHA